MKKLNVWLKVLLLVSIVLAQSGLVTNAKVIKETVVEMQLGNPIMTVNGIRCEIQPGSGIAPVTIRNRTYVPIRAIIEAFEGKVSFISDTSEIFLSMEDNLIRLKLNSKVAYLNGYKRFLETEVTTVNGVAMVPIRYVAQGLKLKVNWNERTNKISIVKRIEIDDEEEIVLVHDDPRRFSERKYMEDQIRKEQQALAKASTPYDGERLVDDGLDAANRKAEEEAKKQEEETAKAEAEQYYQQEYTGES